MAWAGSRRGFAAEFSPPPLLAGLSGGERRAPARLSAGNDRKPAGLGVSLALHAAAAAVTLLIARSAAAPPDAPSGEVELEFQAPSPPAAAAFHEPEGPSWPEPPSVPPPSPPAFVPPSPPSPETPPPAPEPTPLQPPKTITAPPPPPVAAPRPVAKTTLHPPKTAALPRPAREASPQTTASSAAAGAPHAAVQPGPANQAPTADSEPALVPAHPVAGLASNDKPLYPPVALRRREQGTVVVRVSVGADGRPVSASIEQSSGHPLLDEAATVKIMRDWRFVAASRGGLPVSGSALVPFSFQIGE